MRVGSIRVGGLGWAGPILNALVFGIFAAAMALRDALWMNKDGVFYSDEFGGRVYDLATMAQYFLLRLGIFFAVVVVVEFPVHILVRRLIDRLVSAEFSTVLLLPFLDAWLLSWIAAFARHVPWRETFYLVFAPLLVVEIVIAVIGWLLTRLLLKNKKPRAG
jgi:uncharacterized membrane protein YhaH (DUF805 family)